MALRSLVSNPLSYKSYTVMNGVTLGIFADSPAKRTIFANLQAQTLDMQDPNLPRPGYRNTKSRCLLRVGLLLAARGMILARLADLRGAPGSLCACTRACTGEHASEETGSARTRSRRRRWGGVWMGCDSASHWGLSRLSLWGETAAVTSCFQRRGPCLRPRLRRE